MATLLDPRTAYELWADTYASAAHNPLMRAEETVVERVLRTVSAATTMQIGRASCRERV